MCLHKYINQKKKIDFRRRVVKSQEKIGAAACSIKIYVDDYKRQTPMTLLILCILLA